ncbi:MAG: FtsW/RodA/SpoVE family cell cycle protein [Planctomycetota bacterium]
MKAAVRQYLRYTSWPILLAMIGLIVVGVMAISVSERAAGNELHRAKLQMAYAAIGLAVFFVMTFIPYPRIGRLAYGLFAATLVVLVGVLLLPETRGSHRWIDLKIVKVQPSEFAKLSFIILLAWYLRHGDHYRTLKGLVVPFVLTFLPMGLIFIEPDLGTSLLFLPTLYFMLFMAGAKLRHLLGIVAVGTVLVFLPTLQNVSPDWDPRVTEARRALSYARFGEGDDETLLIAVPLAVMKSHQLDRVDGWLRQGDLRVAMDKGFQLHWSKMVLGGGKVTGAGDWEYAEQFYRILPDDHTDFIFSIIGGEWGFVGCCVVLGLYGVIFLFGLEIAAMTDDPFGRLLAVGVLGLLLSQLMINVGMTMGLMPITGMTLPWLSYGGSSLVMNCAAVGLLVNVGQRRPILLSRRAFEHGEKREKPPGVTGPIAEGDWRRPVQDDQAEPTETSTTAG